MLKAIFSQKVLDKSGWYRNKNILLKSNLYFTVIKIENLKKTRMMIEKHLFSNNTN